MKNRGFTLVELLAVIVILAIILAIAIPSISGMISSTTKSTFESNAKMVLKGIEYKKMEDESFNPSSINETNVKEELNIDDSNYETLTVKEINGIIYLTIVGKNKWNKLTVSGTKIISKVNDTVTDFVRGANAPVLVTGMTPIKWNGTTWVDTTKNDTDWYNYNMTDKKWANARTADGSMWVWIPRYIYKIPEANWHTSTAGSIDIQFSKGVDDNWNKGEIGNINLDQSAEASKEKWTNHPAFTFGDIELTGIWVSKFEAGGTTDAIDFKPNVTSLRDISIDTMFTATRSMETNDRYGWGTSGNGIDTHLMKNTEWGAVTYLTQSTYGKNAIVWNNPSSDYITGCAGNNAKVGSSPGCANTYNSSNGMQASTTGNIYGVYDLSGGANEYIAAYVNNSSDSKYGSTIVAANDKYKDIYEVGTTDDESNNYILTINHKGDAIYETSTSGLASTAWYSDSTAMPKTSNKWFLRGGCYYSYGTTGFSFAGNTGISYILFGFHTILAISNGI